MLWVFTLLGLGVLAYFAIKGRIIRLREEFREALRRASQRQPSSLPSEDMVKCQICGTYSAPAQQRNCGAAGCPYKTVARI